MSEEQTLVVLQSREVASVKPHRTREMILKPVGIADDPTKSLAKVIKGHLRGKGLKGKNLDIEYLRILKAEGRQHRMPEIRCGETAKEPGRKPITCKVTKRLERKSSHSTKTNDIWVLWRRIPGHYGANQ